MHSDPLIISYHPSFSEEKKYILDLLFRHFLGFDCRLQEHQDKRYEVLLPNQNKLIINDAFFSAITSESYLDIANLPCPVNSDSVFPEDRFSCLCMFGSPSYSVDNENDVLTGHWNNDVIAASYFMLTRWEESIPGSKRDELGRFPESEHLSVRFNFAQRPIVNEYLVGIKAALQDLDCRIPDLVRSYSVFPEHDIDTAERFPDGFKWMKSLLGDLFQGRGPQAVQNTWNSGISRFLKKGLDPFEKYDFLMDVSESAGLKSCFYFIGGQGIDSDLYPLQSKRLYGSMQRIRERGHSFAFHPGLETYKNPELYEIELKRIHQLLPEATTVRQHYLQFKLPYTLRLAADKALKLDTSLGFKDRIGFRNGICYSYPFFDILLRKPMNIEVSSFCLMDMALWRMGLNGDEALKVFKDLADTIHSYQGDFRFIWHNSSFEVAEWVDLSASYRDYVHAIVFHQT